MKISKSHSRIAVQLSAIIFNVKLIMHGEKTSTASRVAEIFDSTWYLACNEDVRKSRINPLLHYILHGNQEGRLPNPYFDACFYRRNHKDDALAQANPVYHYLANARSNGNHPCAFFENDWYQQQYLSAHQSEIPLAHFLKYGEQARFRPHPLFDDQRYLTLNPDVERDVRRGIYPSGFRHFVTKGAEELEVGAYRHFNFDWGSHRLDYDRTSYLFDNPDVRNAISQGRVKNGIEHIFSVGWREALDGLRSIYGKRHQVRLINTFDGDAPNTNSRYLCLFAHYDRDGVVDPYVEIYLRSLRKVNVEIVFISATNDEKELAKVKSLVSKFILKNEAGRDFGSWYLALKTLDPDYIKTFDRVIFANDSIYFPVRPIEPLFVDMENKKFNVYGLSDSREVEAYHLQSFFLAFDRVAQACIFPQFVEQFERNYLLTKWGQIREYEVGLTKMAQQHGLSVGAHFSVDDCREAAMHDPHLSAWKERLRLGLGNINPTHDLWDLMIGWKASPVLKLELLRDNPKKVSGLNELDELIEDGVIPVDVIEAHVKRSKSPPTRTLASITSDVSRSTDLRLLRRIRGTGRSVSKRLVLFAHYDPDHVVDPHILYQVRAIEAADCAVVFITSVTEEQELLKVTPLVRDVLIKPDVGRDFGSWALAVSVLKEEFKQFNDVIWMNDSTYFPLFDPTPMFDDMERRRLDFWGVVDSKQTSWHVMSWFWAFGRGAIAEGWFDWYLAQYNPHHSKWAQINNYEMRMPKLLKDAGLSVGSYIRSEEVRSYILDRFPGHSRIEAALRGDFTMTHDFWAEIIRDFRCPALKVELLRDNPLGVDLSRMPDFIKANTDFNFELMKNHLLRVKLRHLLPPSKLDFPPIH